MLLQYIEESITYDVLLSFFSGDYKKAFQSFSLAGSRFDLSMSFPSFSSQLAPLIGARSEHLDEIYRNVRDAYGHFRADFIIIPSTSALFDRALCETECPVPFLYAVGNIALLAEDHVTICGGLAPSEEAREIAEKCAAVIARSKRCMMTPLMLGLSSWAISAFLKESSKLIAVSSSFVLKCPNEKIKDQMVDILRHGGLIISPVSPLSADIKYHQVVRNRAISALSDRILLVEEKDGGPAWHIFDEVKGEDKVRMISAHMLTLPSFSFAYARKQSSLILSKAEDVKKLFRPMRRSRKKTESDENPSLFQLQ